MGWFEKRYDAQFRAVFDAIRARHRMGKPRRTAQDCAPVRRP
jgi:hypothetical protein